MSSVSKYPADVNVRIQHLYIHIVFQCSSDVNVVAFVVDLRFSISIKENERTISHGKGQVNNKKHREKNYTIETVGIESVKNDLKVKHEKKSIN